MTKDDGFDTEFDTELDNDQPPVEDIDSPAAEDETGDFNVDVDAYGDDEIDDQAAAKKQRNNLLFKAGVGVIAIGAAAFFVLRPSAPPQTLAPTQTAAMPMAPIAEAVPAAEQPAPVAENEFDLLPPPVAAATEVQGQDYIPEDPLAWSSAPSTRKRNTDTTAPVAATETEQPATANADPLAWAGDAAAVETAQPVAETTAVVADAAPVDATAPAAAPAPVASTPQVGALEERLGVIEQALATIEDNAVTKADLASLQDSIAKLQQQLESQPAKTATSKQADTPKITSATKKPAVKRQPVATPAKKAAPAAVAAPSKSWVLNAAKPGMAWVSERGTKEFRTVSVGDTLPGIGRITSIDVGGNGLWVVVGTNGRISQ